MKPYRDFSYTETYLIGGKPAPSHVKRIMEKENRYERQTALPEIGTEGQVRLKQARVLIIGLGGLGCPAALYLNAAGIGMLRLVDDDVVSWSNLQRQVLYTEADLGQSKAMCAASRLQAQNGSTRLEAYTCRVNENNIDSLLEGIDAVIDACDNFATRYIVSDACLRAHIPYIYGAVRGFEGQVSVCGVPPRLRTYRDLYPDQEVLCTLPPDRRVVSMTPAVVGSVQAAEVLKLLLGCGEPLCGRLWTIDLRTLDTHILTY